MRDWYKSGDKKRTALEKANEKIFRKSRLTLDFDNINQPVKTIRSVSKQLYKKLAQKSNKAYLDLGLLVYMEAFEEAQSKAAESEISAKSKKAINKKWLDKFQREYNPITKYVYENELERKQARFFESIVADVEAKDRHEMEADYKTAENAWKRQTRQAMIDVEDRAAITGYKDAGVEKVRWITQRDERVCKECIALNGLIFPIDRVPDKPHYNCRCYLEPVKRLKKPSEPDIIKLPDVKVIKAVGAKSINDDVMDLITGERFYLVPGTTIKNVEVFAGKGVRKPYEKAYKYADALGGNVEDWQHVKGKGLINYYGEERMAEIHWSRCDGIGDVDRFIKRWIDED